MKWRIVLAVVLLAQGLGHSLFLAESWGLLPAGATGPDRTWLLGQPPETGLAAGRLAGLLWLAPLTGFAAAARMLLARDRRARPWLLGAAAASAALVALAWGGIDPSGALIVLGVDGAVIEGAWMPGAPAGDPSRLRLPVPPIGRGVSPMRWSPTGSTVGIGRTGHSGRVGVGRPGPEGGAR